jgi:hypothetical protein
VCAVWSPRGAVSDVARRNRSTVVTLRDGSRHEHVHSPGGWRVEFVAAGARSTVDLGGIRPEASTTTRSAPEPARVIPTEADVEYSIYVRAPGAGSGARSPLPWYADASESARARFAVLELGEPHYRRSELSWRDAGGPTATAAFAVDGDDFVIEVDVRKTELCFVPAGRANELDNEQPDINSDGLQLYVLGASRVAGRRVPTRGAWVMVPEPDGASLRVREIPGADRAVPLRAEWRRTPDGYAIRCTMPLRELADAFGGRRQFLIDLAVNEITPDRERRRGQLVLSGARGEWVYLRGDRQPPGRFVVVEVLDAPRERT